MPDCITSEDLEARLRRLAEMFGEADGRIPAIVFALLRHYYANGPFGFDAEKIARVLEHSELDTRTNATQIADMQGEIERFFEPGPQGLIPRRGVLS